MPENTIEAFELALRLGASGLESDVWITADGVAVLDADVFHRDAQPVGHHLRKRGLVALAVAV